ncbi:hypothetical protein GJ744_010048 [Endocarpon pusillum]|uniref:Uncharacterized protein n=1 Tax=Endocarpon pusillum TaxID=364733 RepID=A0A8H7AGX2_9EURO|nr:hypothetical protein GJ744_010048 [Endocarpon pusillum]
MDGNASIYEYLYSLRTLDVSVSTNVHVQKLRVFHKPPTSVISAEHCILLTTLGSKPEPVLSR